jgi:glyoxylase-like metal-dependent hydrolase (beta-lactamase superfamily II)
MHEVLAVRYGTLRSRKSELYYRFGSYGEPDAEQSLDYWFWVLRDGDSTLLVDTGFDPSVGERRGRVCLCPPLDALARLGIEPGSIERIVITHLHYDHIGNLGAFPHAELLVPERELAFWSSPAARHTQFAEHVETGEVTRVLEGRFTALPERSTIAPGVEGIVVGGHSPGQLMLLVATANGPVVLTSDAVHLYEELERRRPFAVLANLEEMYAAYDTIDALGATMVPGHDPQVADRFETVADIAVRIA